MSRLALVVVGALLAVAAMIAVALVFSARDDSQLQSAREGPGEPQPDRGASHGQPAEPSGPEPPTSGTHRADLVTRDRRELSDDQIIHALELGNVVIVYGAAEPDPALVRLQEDVVGGPFDAELAAAGQAVILAPRLDAGPATALAWRRSLRVEDPSDPRLREFAEAWLGSGVQP